MQILKPAVVLTIAAVALLGMAGQEPAAPAPAPPPPAAQLPSAERGHALVLRDCASCHAVETIGVSGNSLAPPFRTLHDRYPTEVLEEALAEGILSGHPAMPEFAYGSEDIADIIAWLKGLEAK